MEFIFKYHPAWLIVVMGLAFVYSFYLYRKDVLLEDVKISITRLLATFRFVAVGLICVLLLGIILENFVNREEKPLIFIAHDSSESILLNKDSVYYRTEYLDDLRKLSTDLQKDYEVIEYSFSDILKENFDANYSGKLTNISLVFNQIFDQYTNRNIGAIIMSTDGIYNSGSNPMYAILRKSFLPIFTVGLGDTNQVRDLKIEFVKHNDIAFLGNQFPVEVILAQSKCDGEKVKVGIYNGDQLISEQEVQLEGNDQQIRLNYTLKANSIGYQKYTISTSIIEDEFSVKNNESNFYIEVINGRQKLLVAHNGPHPDISVLRFVIESNRNYEVDVEHQADVKDVANYDLIVLHNYQPTNPELNNIINSGSTACLFIVGNKTNIPGLVSAKVGLTGNKTDTQEVGFSANSNFKDILLSPAVVQMLNSAPPLQAPFGDLNFSGAIDILAFQKIGNIILDKPLIYFTQKNRNRYGVIMGEGIWRWRLHDQARNGTTSNFVDIIGKMITYLSIKDNKDPFRVRIKNEYAESENVLVKAELYNKSYELINEPEVKFQFENEAGRTFEPYFVQLGNHYQLDLGKMEQGVYQWNASTNFQKTPYKKSGKFLVREVKLEVLNSQADHRLLMNIAQNSGGEFYLPVELEALKNDISKRKDLVTVVYQEKSFDDLIDYKILFFLVFSLLAVEWFIRKFHGAY